MKKKKVVLFDIDYTLFDTELLRKKMYEAVFNTLPSTGKRNKNIVSKIYKEVVEESGYFKPSEFIGKVVKKLGSEFYREKLRKAIWDSSNFKGNLYSETITNLEEVAKKATIGIFSKGYSKRWQKTKLKPFIHLLKNEHIHITINKYTTLPLLLKKYSNTQLYMVDDALPVLREAKKLNGSIIAIWVKRGMYAKMQAPIEGFYPDAIIGDLNGLISIVESKK